MSEDKSNEIPTMPPGSNFRVRTEWNFDNIKTTVDLFHHNTLVNRVLDQVMEMRERQTQLALINLGWTPPAEIAEEIENDRVLGERPDG